MRADGVRPQDEHGGRFIPLQAELPGVCRVVKADGKGDRRCGNCRSEVRIGEGEGAGKRALGGRVGADPVEHLVAAGDQIVERPGCALEEGRERDGGIAVDEAEFDGVVDHEMSKAHASTLPRVAAHRRLIAVTYGKPFPPQPSDSERQARGAFEASYSSPWAQQPSGPGYAPVVPSSVQPLRRALPVQPRKGRSVALWMFAAVGAGLPALASYFFRALGSGATILGFVLALIPLAVVLLVVRYIDRWEPEPAQLVALALGWGAIVSVGFALLVDRAIMDAVPEPVWGEAFTSVVRAPLVEEFIKGVGLLIIFVLGRRAFDGPVDGIVYGALIGAGFAFTENIQYFALAFLSGGSEQVSSTFLLRGIMSPFAHAMFTCVTGYVLGRLARRGVSGGAIVVPWIMGMLGASALHAFWNWSAVVGDFFLLYFVLQVPMFIISIVVVTKLRGEEQRLTRERLGEYADAGWFTAQEVEMLATPQGRKAAMRWAAGLRGDRRPLMESFITDATQLAAARQRAITGRDPAAREDERVLLERATATRAALLSY